MKLISNWIKDSQGIYSLDIYSEPTDSPICIGFPESMSVMEFIEVIESFTPTQYPGWVGNLYFNAGGVKSVSKIMGTSFQVVTNDCVMVYRGSQSDGYALFDRYVKDGEKETIVMPLRVDPDSDQVDSFEDWGYDNDTARVVPVFKATVNGGLLTVPILMGPTTDYVDWLYNKLTIPVEIKTNTVPLQFHIKAKSSVNYLTTTHLAFSVISRIEPATANNCNWTHIKEGEHVEVEVGTLTCIASEAVFDTSDEHVTSVDAFIEEFLDHFTSRGSVHECTNSGIQFVQLVSVSPGQKFIS